MHCKKVDKMKMVKLDFFQKYLGRNENIATRTQKLLRRLYDHSGHMEKLPVCIDLFILLSQRYNPQNHSESGDIIKDTPPSKVKNFGQPKNLLRKTNAIKIK